MSSSLTTFPHFFCPYYLPSCLSPSPSPTLLSFSTKSRSFKLLCCCLSTDQSTTTTATNLRVVFAAGGTGGHIIPALAMADELKLSKPTTHFLFIGSPNSMESIAIPSSNYPFASIPPSRLYRPFLSLRNLLLPFQLIKSTFHSFKLLKHFDPHVVVGTGGYVSFPTCLAALIRGIKVVIQEQNSVPGVANYVISYFAEVVLVAFNSTVECFPRKNKCVVTGNPVRIALRRVVEKDVARCKFFQGIKKEGKVILVLGGSLGANAINIALLNVYSQMLLEHKNWFLIWQTGVEAYNEMESLVRNHPQLVLSP